MDEQAFTHHAERERSRAINYIKRRFRLPHTSAFPCEPEDIYQEALIQLWEQRNRIQDFTKFLYHILKRNGQDWRMAAYSHDVNRRRHYVATKLSSSLRDATPQHAWMRSDDMIQAINALPHPYKETAEGFYIGLTYQELGDLLGITVVTVWRRWSTLKDALSMVFQP